MNQFMCFTFFSCRQVYVLPNVDLSAPLPELHCSKSVPTSMPAFVANDGSCNTSMPSLDVYDHQ